MRIELLALAVPAALALRFVGRRRPPVRNDAAEALRWWGLARGLGDPGLPTPGALPEPAPGFDPLDVALGLQGHAPPDQSQTLSAVVPSHAITLQGSALFRTGGACP